MNRLELIDKLDEAIGSRRTFKSATFGVRITEMLRSPRYTIRTAEDLYSCCVLVWRRNKLGGDWVLETMTEGQVRRAWAVLDEHGAANTPTERFEYRLTTDVWGHEPGVGKVPTILDEVIWARNDADAMRQAEMFHRGLMRYQWTAWKRDATGWERYRTAAEFTAGWMRIEAVVEE